MTHELERDWKIVAPWWKWGKTPADTADTMKGRLTVPVFQKYEAASFVNDFLRDPQRCLKFVDDDVVHSAVAATVPLDKKNRRRRFGLDLKDGFRAFDYVRDPHGTRKIFLDTHKRFYLVVCQLHCDGSGFPKVAQETAGDRICEAGFVVRRRTARIPSVALKPLATALQGVSAGRAKLALLDALEPELRAAAGGVAQARAGVRLTTFETQRASVKALLEADRGRLLELARRFEVALRLQGWMRSAQGFDKIGSWQDIDETPPDLGFESTFPLYPLIADRNNPRHAGHFGTVYFGLLPTGTGETEPSGTARFDERELYEVRCFVKRHREPHPRGGPCRCPDGLFWSRPTEPYRIASHFDLAGTSNRPVTIQLPDLKDLAAQAKPMPGVAFSKPPDYPMVGGTPAKPEKGPSLPGFQICSFPVVLITIVASFVFELFLPVVTLLFGLFWMLKLKLCIPPEISVDAGLTAELQLEGKLEFAVDAKLDFEATLMIGGKTFQDVVEADIDKNFPPANGPLNSRLKAEYAGIALANLEISSAAAAKSPPDITANLDFEAEVTHA